jgi:hypothetical protein
MDELMAGELADKIERALASEYELGVAAGIREGLEQAGKVADDFTSRPLYAPEYAGTHPHDVARRATASEIAELIRSLINEAKP